MDGVPWFITCCLLDRRHYRVRGGLMDHVADARDAAQRALSDLAVKPSRLPIDVDQSIFLAGDDGDWHRQAGIVLPQSKGTGDHESRFTGARTNL